jgi:hypothetical protein
MADKQPPLKSNSAAETREVTRRELLEGGMKVTYVVPIVLGTISMTPAPASAVSFACW